MRHRVLLNFEGEAEGIKTDQVLEQILKTVPEGKAEKDKTASAN
jgi:MoxR-like ATPase